MIARPAASTVTAQRGSSRSRAERLPPQRERERELARSRAGSRWRREWRAARPRRWRAPRRALRPVGERVDQEVRSAMGDARDVVQLPAPRAAATSAACLGHVNVVGGARCRGCAAAGVSVSLEWASYLRLSSRSSRRLAFSSCSSVALVDGHRADLAVDARVDARCGSPVRRAISGHQRVALRAQALAPLEGGLRLRRGAAAADGRERGQRGRDRRRGGSANSCSASPGCVVCSTSSSRRALDHSARNGLARPRRARRARRPRSPAGSKTSAWLRSSSICDREPLQARVRRQEDVAHLRPSAPACGG